MSPTDGRQGLPEPDLGPHLIRCGSCRLPFDPSQLDQVLAHEHAAPAREATGILAEPVVDVAQDCDGLPELLPVCYVCGGPATCLGVYEDSDGPLEHACDEHCGHGNEDGWCVPVCVSCGCTDEEACPGGCWWFEDCPPRCSSCAPTDPDVEIFTDSALVPHPTITLTMGGARLPLLALVAAAPTDCDGGQA